MSGLNISRKIRNSAVAGMCLLCANIAHADTPMTAGVVLEKMGAGERYTYYFGLVQGLAYARFRKDTIANNNQNDQRGMDCISSWFDDGGVERTLQIDKTLEKYPDHAPAVIINAMVRKECGE